VRQRKKASYLFKFKIGGLSYAWNKKNKSLWNSISEGVLSAFEKKRVFLRFYKAHLFLLVTMFRFLQLYGCWNFFIDCE